jgi:sugar lactone lactonase YvrE
LRDLYRLLFSDVNFSISKKITKTIEPTNTFVNFNDHFIIKPYPLMKSKKILALTFPISLCCLLIFSGCQKLDVKPNDQTTQVPVIIPGETSTMAGSGAYGFENGLGSLAIFNNPNGVAVDSEGNVYVTDQANNRIRKITPDGMVSTFAGSGLPGAIDGTGDVASFNNPIGITIDASNNIFITDFGNNLIRKITQAGVVSTWAGSGAIGFDDGIGTLATFNGPDGITVDHSGNVFVSDNHNIIRKITPDREVTTFAGNVHSGPGFADGVGIDANFRLPEGLAVDASNNIYVADCGNNMVRKITPDRVVTTLAGQLTAGFTNGQGLMAGFNIPLGVAADAAGNVYVTDNGNNVVRKITPSGEVTTLAGSGAIGTNDGKNSQATFSDLHGIAVDASGIVYVGDEQNNKIRRIAPPAQ